MDIMELTDACRAVAGGDAPGRDVSELVAAFLHQPNLPGLLGDGDRSTYEALYRGEDILVLHGVVRRRAAASTLGPGGAVEVEQGLVGRMLGYGTVVAGELEVPYVPDPTRLCGSSR